VAKTAKTAIFFLVGICNLRTPMIGRESTRISLVRLPTALTTLGSIGVTQVPGRVGSHALRIGVQGKMQMNKSAREYAVVYIIMIQLPQYTKSCLCPCLLSKMHIICTIMAIFVGDTKRL